MRYLAGVLGLVAVLVAVVVVGGSLLPVKHRATRTALFRIGRTKLAAIILDVSSYPAWRSGVRSIEVLTRPTTDTASGIRYREVSDDGTIEYSMDPTAEPVRIASTITGGARAFGGSWTYELTPEGGATQLRITEGGEVYNPVFRFVSRFITGHHATIDRYLADLARRAGTEP